MGALDEAATLATEFEGYSATPYRCPAGVWTIGYGSTHDCEGVPVQERSPPITRDQAVRLMERDMTAALTEIGKDVRVPLNAVQQGALVDFIYNVGAGNFRASTMLRKINAGDLAGAAAEFPKWNLGGGRVLAGLVARRAREKALFEKLA